MVRYEVIADVAPPHVERYVTYMQAKHFPEIFATGCFERIALDRASATRFRSRYEARTRADVDRYLAEHTARFRADFAAHFPIGVTLSREIWLETFSVDGDGARSTADFS